MSPEDERYDQALDRLWDAIVLGQTRAEEDVDPMDTMSLQMLQQHGQLPDLDPEFRRRLRRALLGARSLPVSTSPSTFAPSERESRLPGPLPFARVPHDSIHGPRRWTWGHLATMALVALTLLAGYIAFGPRPRREFAALVSIPALDGTPAASPVSDLTDETIFLQKFDEIPPRAYWTGVERYVFIPGEIWDQGDQPGSGFGPMLYRLESGTMTVLAAAPFQVTRAGTDVAAAAPAGTEITLAPGDVVFMPFGVTSEWRNSGAAPAHLMDAGIAFISDVSPKDTDANYHYDAFPILPPAAPARFSLRRLVLAPGATAPAPTVEDLAFLGVESGELTIVWDDMGTPSPAPRAERFGPSAMTGARNFVQMYARGTFHIARELRNDGTIPVSVLELTIHSIHDADVAKATPMP
ncbi:MAG: hypothetical protein U0031_11910 [Thermomicrobiales bacterium]